MNGFSKLSYGRAFPAVEGYSNDISNWWTDAVRETEHQRTGKKTENYQPLKRSGFLWSEKPIEISNDEGNC